MIMTLTSMTSTMQLESKHMISSIKYMIFFLHDNRLSVPACSLRVYVREVHGVGIMAHSGVANTLSSLQQHLYCPRTKLDVERLHGQCCWTQFRSLH